MNWCKGVRESHSNVVFQLKHINHKVEELVKEIKLLKDWANKKEKEWLDKKTMYKSDHQEMASGIETLQCKLSTYKIKLSKQELENNSVQCDSKRSTKYKIVRKISIEEKIRNL